MKKTSLWYAATMCLSLTYVSLTGQQLNAVDCTLNPQVPDSKCVGSNTNVFQNMPQGGCVVTQIAVDGFGSYWANCGGGGNNNCAGQTQIQTVKRRRRCSMEGSYVGQGPCTEDTSFTTNKKQRPLKCKGNYDTGIGIYSGKNPPAIGSACPCIKGGPESQAPAADQETFCVCK